MIALVPVKQFLRILVQTPHNQSEIDNLTTVYNRNRHNSWNILKNQGRIKELS